MTIGYSVLITPTNVAKWCYSGAALDAYLKQAAEFGFKAGDIIITIQIAEPTPTYNGVRD